MDALTKEFKEFAKELESDINQAMGELAAITNAKVLEMAQKELKTSRKKYTDALGFEEVAPGIWVVSLDEKAFFIEEGLPDNFDMKPGLLKKGETSKDGTRYRVVPFDHTAPPSTMSITAQQIVQGIKTNLKKANIPFKKIEYNENGSPKTGKLHTLNFGGAIPGRGNTPALQGINIYQQVTKTGQVKRSITTFRTVTDKQTDKWINPGIQAKQFLDKAFDFALKSWEEQILPEILRKYE